MFISIQMLLLLKMDSESRNGESGNGMRRMMVTPGIRGREGQESGGERGESGWEREESRWECGESGWECKESV